MFAGNALIAKQKWSVENNQNYDSIEWRTADPVTGTVGIFSYLSENNGFTTEETEPLGQKINKDDPEAQPDPTYEIRFGNADDPQWQCEVQEHFGGFQGMPWSCQYATKDIQSYEEIPLTTPNHEDGHQLTSAKQEDLPVDATMTDKPPAELSLNRTIIKASVANNSGNTSNQEDCEMSPDGKSVCRVTAQTSYLEGISDSYNAEFNDDEKPNEAVENAITDATTLVGKDKCKNAIEDLLKKAYIEMLKEGKINYEEGKSFYDDFIRDNLSEKSVVDKVSEATKNYDPTNPNISNGGTAHVSAVTKFESGKPTITFYGGFFREIINYKPLISDGNNKTPSTYFGGKTSSLTRAQTIIHEGIHAIFGSSKDLKGFTDRFIGRIIKGKSKDLSQEDGSKAISKFIKDNCN